MQNLTCTSSGGASAGHILIVDDEPHIREVIRGVVEAAGYRTYTAENGTQALRLLHTQPVDVMVADIIMPEMSGLTLLREATRQFPDVPVILLTGQPSVEAAVHALRLGARDFLTKPAPGEEILRSIEKQLRLRRFWKSARGAAPGQNNLAHYFAHVHLLSEVDEEKIDTVLRALANVLDAREHQTQSHSERVSTYAEFLARYFSLSEKTLRDIRRGGLLHDIGKVALPDYILLKQGPLSLAEREQMEQHPRIGYEILRDISYLRQAAEIVLHHHERYNGKGYPLGLRGKEIPLGARVFAVVDSFDAMLSDRPYRSALSFAVARAEILRCSGTQFDPQVVTYFASIPSQTWVNLIAEKYPQLPGQQQDVQHARGWANRGGNDTRLRV